MKNLLIIILSAMILTACAPTTMVTGSWVNTEERLKQYEHVMVAALTPNINAKTTMETDLANQLRDEGVMVTKSSDVFSPNFSEAHNDKEVILDEVNSRNIDAILFVSMLDKDADVRYIPDADPYEPYPVIGYYGNFYGYYSHMYPMVYSPGYYTVEQTYFMEANLYDTDTEELIWSAQSKTYDPEYFDNFSRSFSDAIIDKMEEEEIAI